MTCWSDPRSSSNSDPEAMVNEMHLSAACRETNVGEKPDAEYTGSWTPGAFDCDDVSASSV